MHYSLDQGGRPVPATWRTGSKDKRPCLCMYVSNSKCKKYKGRNSLQNKHNKTTPIAAGASSLPAEDPKIMHRLSCLAYLNLPLLVRTRGETRGIGGPALLVDGFACQSARRYTFIYLRTHLVPLEHVHDESKHGEVRDVDADVHPRVRVPPNVELLARTCV